MIQRPEKITGKAVYSLKTIHSTSMRITETMGCPTHAQTNTRVADRPISLAQYPQTSEIYHYTGDRAVTRKILHHLIDPPACPAPFPPR